MSDPNKYDGNKYDGNKSDESRGIKDKQTTRGALLKEAFEAGIDTNDTRHMSSRDLKTALEKRKEQEAGMMKFIQQGLEKKMKEVVNQNPPPPDVKPAEPAVTPASPFMGGGGAVPPAQLERAVPQLPTVRAYMIINGYLYKGDIQIENIGTIE